MAQAILATIPAKSARVLFAVQEVFEISAEGCESLVTDIDDIKDGESYLIESHKYWQESDDGKKTGSLSTMLNQELANKIKARLVTLAINDDLPSDMNELDERLLVIDDDTPEESSKKGFLHRMREEHLTKDFLINAISAMADIYTEKRTDVSAILDGILEGNMPNADDAEHRFISWIHKNERFTYDTLSTMVDGVLSNGKIGAIGTYYTYTD